MHWPAFGLALVLGAVLSWAAWFPIWTAVDDKWSYNTEVLFVMLAVLKLGTVSVASWRGHLRDVGVGILCSMPIGFVMACFAVWGHVTL